MVRNEVDSINRVNTRVESTRYTIQRYTPVRGWPLDSAATMVLLSLCVVDSSTDRGLQCV